MRFCEYCDAALWPDAPDEMVVWKDESYCDDLCKDRQRYERRRRHDSELYWSHDCSECGRPMFTPVSRDGWWCPECNRSEEIDKSYWTWYREENHGWAGDFEHACPECDSRLWLFDGALVCHNDDCDVYIVQYGREWWALLEQEYPSKTISEQTKLGETP